VKPSQSAALLCKDPAFGLWLDRRTAYRYQLDIPDGTHTETDARDYLYRACQINSRSELDANSNAFAIYQKIRASFKRWKLRQPVRV